MRLALMIALAATLAAPAAADEGPMAHTRQVLEQSSVIVKGPGDRKQKLTALSELLRGYLDTEALATAQRGVYKIAALEPLGAERLRTHFLEGTGANAGYACVRPELRFQCPRERAFKGRRAAVEPPKLGLLRD